MKRKRVRWSNNLAYAVGLIASDGSLSIDGRHIDFTSKDLEQIHNFKAILNLNNKIALKGSGKEKSKKYYRIQFGDVVLYRFLLGAGLTVNKSKIIGALNIPNRYFIDFLRGSLDGDGSISFAKHPESRHLQLRLRFCSASLKHLLWIKELVKSEYPEVKGGFIYTTKNSMNYLTYAKSDANKLLARIYYIKVKYWLSKKREYWNSLRGEWRNWHTRTI